jgi:SAM-dependent MidA family methyltransferase
VFAARDAIGADRSEYVAHVEAAYAAAGVSWFTPVELFKPWYARALARRMLASHATSSASSAAPLRVYELGGGGGTAARGVLDAVAELAPQVYATMTYVSVEARAQHRSAQRSAHTRPWHIHFILSFAIRSLSLSRARILTHRRRRRR